MFDWNDLRYFLAMARLGNSSAAASVLKVNQSTVSRRVAALEHDLKTALFQRSSRGLVLRPEGEKLLALAIQLEASAMAIEQEFREADDSMGGTVRVATVEALASPLIVPALPDFRRRWPGIMIELVTGSRIVDLARGEADVSLRLARPNQPDLVARKVGGFSYSVFSSKSYLDRLENESFESIESLDWMVPDTNIPNMPDMLWLKKNLEGVSPFLGVPA